MDMTEIRRLEEQKVGKIKLSDAIRECGYGDPGTYSSCVIGRAYMRRTGRSLLGASFTDASTYIGHAANTFGVPFKVASQAERMCFTDKSPDQIADYVQAQGY